MWTWALTLTLTAAVQNVDLGLTAAVQNVDLAVGSSSGEDENDNAQVRGHTKPLETQRSDGYLPRSLTLTLTLTLTSRSVTNEPLVSTKPIRHDQI